MPTKKELKKLVETKKALAEKYLRLAQLSKSKPKAATLHLHAEDYRRQAENLSHQL
jgi:hypothetical protein